MVQCPSGSQVAPGAPATFWAGGLPFINFVSSRWAFASAILTGLWPDQLILTSEFCSSEPVIPPAPTLLDFAEASLAVPGALGRILEYWRALYLASVWNAFCQ